MIRTRIGLMASCAGLTSRLRLRAAAVDGDPELHRGPGPGGAFYAAPPSCKLGPLAHQRQAEVARAVFHLCGVVADAVVDDAYQASVVDVEELDLNGARLGVLAHV